MPLSGTLMFTRRVQHARRVNLSAYDLSITGQLEFSQSVLTILVAMNQFENQQQLSAHRDELSKKVAAAVQEFENNTGLLVQQLIPIRGADRLEANHVQVDVKLL
jgi:hypothetical protein